MRGPCSVVILMVSRAKGIPVLTPGRCRDGHPGPLHVLCARTGDSPATPGQAGQGKRRPQPGRSPAWRGSTCGWPGWARGRPGRGERLALLTGGSDGGREREEEKRQPKRGAEEKRERREPGSRGGAERREAAAGRLSVGPGADGRRSGRRPEAGAGGAESRRAAAARGAGGSAGRPGSGPRALWCRGGTRLLLAAFGRGPRSGAGQRSPPAPALGGHEEPPGPPPLPLLEPGAGKSPRAHPRPRGGGPLWLFPLLR